MSFCHLHLHSHYSLLDGANRVKDVVAKASQLGMPAVALTDHGNLFGAVEFHDTAVKHGVKPIIGCEVYVARNGRKVKEGRSSQSNHLVLLARNQKGYENLSRLVSLGYLEGFYYRPRIDRDLLARHSEGLIGLSACLQGSVAQFLTQDRYDQARREAGEMNEILGAGNYFLELQDHRIEDQKTVNQGILRLSAELGIPLVATNDCHYLERLDARAHDLLLCIQTGKTQEDTDRLVYKTDEFYFKTPQEMLRLFEEVPEAISNTLRVAEMCEFGFGPTRHLFPDFQVPDGHDVDSYFEQVVRDGFAERAVDLRRLEREGRLTHTLDQYEQRLANEIRVIREMRFSAYFLIVWDFIRYARENLIPVGPGRGSAAGSLVAYAMRITDVDPLRYNLLFERFLNPERVTPPDIDIDFCMHRRGEVIEYVTEQYGRDNVSHIISFGTMKARAAIRDVGRSMNIPFAEVDKIAKLVPLGPKVTLEKSVESVKELQQLAESDPRYRDLVQVAQRLEGLSRHASIHPAGVVIAPRPLIDVVPLFKSNKDEITTQYSMSDLERLGLLKMDFLGLTTLTVLDQAVKQIRDQLEIEINLEELPLDDEKTLQLFCEGRTSGIFQFESAGMRDILRRLQPSRFEDLIALNALYRPGPIKGGMIDNYIDRRHGRIQVTYELPELEEILRETYGVIVYQEQVMQVASRLAGFSLGEADLLRRAMGKKKKDVMEGMRRKFLDGAGERGFDPAKAERIFDLMEQFAEYGFNKSHSTAYALLAYQTAYLKAHYPVQFMAALLTSEMSNTDKIVQYLGEAREMGLKVLPPDINTSHVHFAGTRAGEIRFGLAAVKNVGEGAIRAIIERRREHGPFRGLFNFCEEIDPRFLNKRVIESLIKAGAFDALGVPRKSLMAVLDRSIERSQKKARDRLSGQRDLFGGASVTETAFGEEIPDLGEWGDREKWTYEKEVLGFYLSGHPLQKYEAELKRFCHYQIAEIDPEMSGREMTLGGVISGYRKLQTRKGDTMAALQLEDMSGTVEVILFPRHYEQYRDYLESEVPVCVRGRCDVDARGEVKILCEEMLDLASVWKNGVQKARIRIQVSSLEGDGVDRLQSLLQRHPGQCELEFELIRPHRFSIQVIPSEPLRVSPEPAFVQAVESLFGEKSCILEISR